MFSVCACYAVIRSQFALVFTGLGYTESQFGLYLTVYALCNFAALVAAGRWAMWHFKPSLLLVGQALLLVMLLLTIYGKALSVFHTASVLLGIAYGFAYCSHLYYGASASRKRSARMAIHEIVISLGLTIGSLAGGYLAEHVGLYTPYWFAVGLVGLGTASRSRSTLPRGPGRERCGVLLKPPKVQGSRSPDARRKEDEKKLSRRAPFSLDMRMSQLVG